LVDIIERILAFSYPATEDLLFAKSYAVHKSYNVVVAVHEEDKEDINNGLY